MSVGSNQAFNIKVSPQPPLGLDMGERCTKGVIEFWLGGDHIVEPPGCYRVERDAHAGVGSRNGGIVVVIAVRKIVVLCDIFENVVGGPVVDGFYQSQRD